MEKPSTNKDVLMLSLSKYYSTKKNIDTLIEIIQGKHTISLRLIDWFVTNYAKKHNTTIELPDNNSFTSYFKIYMNYRAQLKAYSKQQFDPFRRRERITFIYEHDKSIETTIGQLNFFRWVIENKLIDYVQTHMTDIEQDMLMAQKSKKNNMTKGKSKINDLGNNCKMNKMHVPMVISFT